MKKNIKLLSIPTESLVSWVITSNVPKNVNIKLSGDKRLLFDCHTHAKGVSSNQGSTYYSGSELELVIETEESFETSLSSSDLLSSDSENQGQNFFISCKLTKSFSDLYIQVSALNNLYKVTSETEFMMSLFYQYLTLKNKYHVNYISDPYVGKLCGNYDDQVGIKKKTVQEWFDIQYKDITDEVQKYKLILTTLMKHERIYANTSLTHRCWADMMFVTGDKHWKESRITMQSNPFQYIRGIIMTDEERKNYQDCLNTLGNVALTYPLILGASHAHKESSLGYNVKRAMNFRNGGIYVYQESDYSQVSTISKSIQYAGKNKAKVLIFPELCINKNRLQMLQSYLGKNGGDLKLVIGGSYYEPTSSGSYYNLAPILYKNKNGEWGIYQDYRKKVPFSMPTTKKTENYDLLVEDIELPDSIRVIPFKDIIIGVAICRDVMDLTDKHNPIHKYCDFVDLMLVISDNTGDSNMFVGTAECLARWHNCATLYTNSVAETKKGERVDNKLEVSFGLYPSKGGPSSTSVAGVISYIEKPSFANAAKDASEIAQILYSGSIAYEALKEEELLNCCKIYEMK